MIAADFRKLAAALRGPDLVWTERWRERAICPDALVWFVASTVRQHAALVEWRECLLGLLFVVDRDAAT